MVFPFALSDACVHSLEDCVDCMLEYISGEAGCAARSCLNGNKPTHSGLLRPQLAFRDVQSGLGETAEMYGASGGGLGALRA